MKFIILAALAVATPALAQTTPPATPMDQSAMPAPAAATDSQTMPPATPSDTTTQPMGSQPPMAGQPPMAQPMPMAQSMPMAAPATAGPAPAPQASYPRCSKTVKDQCVERGGRK